MPPATDLRGFLIYVVVIFGGFAVLAAIGESIERRHRRYRRDDLREELRMLSRDGSDLARARRKAIYAELTLIRGRRTA